MTINQLESKLARLIRGLNRIHFKEDGSTSKVFKAGALKATELNDQLNMVSKHISPWFTK